MFDSALMPQESHPAEDVVSLSPAEGLLVLDPVGDVPGIQPILLDGRRQFIGTDAACAIQLPDSSVRSRHAVILRGRRHNIIKAFDRRTWLNGLPVTESLLRDGDRLQAGPFDFCVREATAGELTQPAPAERGSAPGAGHEQDVAGQLALRRERLSAIRTRLKERRAQLRQEQVSFQAERALFETSRTRHETGNQAVTDASERVKQADATRRDAVTNNWERDADRVEHLFQRPSPHSSNVASSNQATECGATIADQAHLADEHSETANSVNDYMEQLLSRRRAERAEPEQPPENAKPAVWAAQTGAQASTMGASTETGEAAAVPVSHVSQTAELTSTSGAGTEAPVVGLDALAERGVKRERRQVAINELRAGVDSLREVANVSARTAVAKHTSRKLRRLYAGTLALTTISFILVGVFAYLGQSDSRCYGLSFGAMMVGLILLIEFRYRFWKIRNVHSTGGSKSARHQATPRQTEKSPSAADTAGGSSPSLPSR